ncbi:Uncharacterised protein [Bordetella pertussis]|nr:Uncharacterised protein [Bordetella pertussis]CFP65841.1 Uncharacterised protein [Bordetella pertussis]CFW39658.1 Uncharacterised protein [Bordetella pertussis]
MKNSSSQASASDIARNSARKPRLAVNCARASRSGGIFMMGGNLEPVSGMWGTACNSVSARTWQN